MHGLEGKIKKVGIVGSRKRKDRESVVELIKSFSSDTVIVTGGAKGIDTYAEEEARKRRLKVIIHKPDLKSVKHRGEMVERYYQRNRKIVGDSDILYAFVSSERKGGTENTIKWAKQMGKKVFLK